MNDGLLQQLLDGDFPIGERVVLAADSHKRLPAEEAAVKVLLINSTSAWQKQILLKFVYSSQPINIANLFICIFSNSILLT